jgi:shikimate kinase
VTNRKIIIVGFMGSGKSTVAAAVGPELGCDVIDLDEAITRVNGRTPGEIIEHDGEPAFREIETQVLRDVLSQDRPAVIALGGGAWTIDANRELIAQTKEALVVWLDAPVELCWTRILSTNEKRPLAATRETTEKLYRERRSAYELADQRIAVSQTKSVREIVATIIAFAEPRTTFGGR